MENNRFLSRDGEWLRFVETWLDKKNSARNRVLVIKQFEQTGTHANRYDLPLLLYLQRCTRLATSRSPFDDRYNQSARIDDLSKSLMQAFPLEVPHQQLVFSNQTPISRRRHGESCSCRYGR